MNIPVSFDLISNTNNSKGAKGFDAELIVDALEKMRDYIAVEHKKIREDFLKLHLDFEAKIRDKIDKKDIEDIESKNNHFISLNHRED